MDLTNLLILFSDKGCDKVYIKTLSPNDNSKNQIYFGGNFDVLNIFPSGAITVDKEGQRKKETFKAKLNFYWLNAEGDAQFAPQAQFILYPEYPEVRFSGFLRSSKTSFSPLLTSREANRLLFMGVGLENKIYGYVCGSETEISNELKTKKNLETHGVFNIIKLVDTKSILIQELLRIHKQGWICSKRLNSARQIVPCINSNCGGYTLEAELDIPSNSVSEPDFLGWEIKQFRVPNFNRFGSTSITLMDHSPTDGYFSENGIEAFIRKYGYADRRGRESRINFGGTHRFETVQKLTSLRLIVKGYNIEKKQITDQNGYVALVDPQDNLAASWTFKSIIDHWKSKHPQACYVPSIKQKMSDPNCSQKYWYGNKIILGRYTDVSLFLYQLCTTNVYYDPGIKLELAIEGVRKQNIKVRSLFRTKPASLSSLYYENEIVDLSILGNS